MGNYKTASAVFVLDKETPYSIIELFIDMMMFKGDIKYTNGFSNRDLRLQSVVESLNKSKCFKNSNLNIDKNRIESYRVSILPIVPFSKLSQGVKDCLDVSKNEVALELSYYISYMFFKAKNPNIRLNGHILDVALNEFRDTNELSITAVKNAIKSKGYTKIKICLDVCSKYYDNDFEIFVKFLKPYLIKNHPLKIGKVSDEDGYINRGIYLDNEIFKKMLEDREYVCNGCDKFSNEVDCPFFKYCNRAYKIGKMSK